MARGVAASSADGTPSDGAALVRPEPLAPEPLGSEPLGPALAAPEPTAPTAPVLSRASALSRCVGVADSAFHDAYWGKRPLLTRRNIAGASATVPTSPQVHSVDTTNDRIDIAVSATQSGFDDLMSISAVDELVSTRGLRTPFARMAKDGSMLPDRSFTRSGGTGAQIADQLADDKILSQIADGASLVLQGLHRTWPPLIEFAGNLMAELGHPAQINAYITPAGNRGFAPHYDTHDVFVLQVAGHKHWQIHEPVLPNPLADQTWEQRRDEVTARAAQPPMLDTVLGPGDALYLPRGYLHSATANDDLCVHLTVGVHPFTAATLLAAVLANPAAPAELRESLPAGVDLTDPATLMPLLATAVSAFETYAAQPLSSVPALADSIGGQLRRGIRPAPVGPLAQLRLIAELTPHTVLRRRSGLHVVRRQRGELIELHWSDRTMSVPLTAGAALDIALSGEPFTAAELAMDSHDELQFCRRLLEQALVVAAGDGSD